MNAPVDPFAKFAAKLTDQEQLRVRNTMDELGLTRTDALFHIMAALEYHRVLYERIPQQIKDAGDRALEAVNEAANLQAAKELVAAKYSLAEEVVDAARRLSARRDREGTWAFASLTAIAILVGIVGAFWIGRITANDDYARRTAEPMAWFNSSNGQYALYLSRAGVLDALRICRGENRTLAVGPTKMECGLLGAPMREGRRFPLTEADPFAVR